MSASDAQDAPCAQRAARGLARGWTLRRATAEDAAELARLSGELGYVTTGAEMAQRLAGLRDATNLVVVASDASGRLGAWLHATESLSLESGFRVEIAGLVVDAACRRQGLGAALVAEAERWARTRNAPQLVVRSNVTRDESHVFYPAQGFARSKTQHVYRKSL